MAPAASAVSGAPSRRCEGPRAAAQSVGEAAVEEEGAGRRWRVRVPGRHSAARAVDACFPRQPVAPTPTCQSSTCQSRDAATLHCAQQHTVCTGRCTAAEDADRFSTNFDVSAVCWGCRGSGGCCCCCCCCRGCCCWPLPALVVLVSSSSAAAIIVWPRRACFTTARCQLIRHNRQQRGRQAQSQVGVVRVWSLICGTVVFMRGTAGASSEGPKVAAAQGTTPKSSVCGPARCDCSRRVAMHSHWDCCRSLACTPCLNSV